MLASACPGWICYAEKTHAEMLPFISTTKSPQQVMGTLVKEWMGAKWGRRPDQIYHVTVMPCYDKKLEASRQDFYNEMYATRDVDCVITTGELELLMREKQWDLSMPVPGEAEAAPARGDGDEIELPELIVHPGTSSGSYLQSLIALLLADARELELAVRTVRGADYEEYTLADRATGAVVFKGAKCYGFRNLQNVVRKVGREAGVQIGRGAAGRMAALRGRGRGRKGDAGDVEKGYDYVEVMACPGGCVNGGGQLRPQAVQPQTDAEGYQRDWAVGGVKVDGDGVPPGSDARWGTREWTRKVEEAYWHAPPTPPPSPGHEDDRVRAPDREQHVTQNAERLAAEILVDLCRPQTPAMSEMRWNATMDAEAEERRRRLFRTQYKAVESEVVGLAVKW
ncbi:hypothetical protein POSPLADRAFT_1131939 [Postia placenta MAD-698-R-SB12]|uniref:Iron hydrogenase large subunit C-terminal domain-containing protein n=1 Tax=Postia placenta MAD-698-R-SB12 TaxID=670580 RepID=A0A1X6NCQ9_9APHY|nr:hypothetical protein POSPLADRAFT_1131939 [Postia placenta MAD-698-R-SB12]OSX66411.1 hypothetical protein POSPLADRAFT_1131939 [Postia placenta MAD-698-R-SB12]